MRWPFFRRTTVVRIGGGPYVDGPVTRDAPSRPSEHEHLLDELDDEPSSWARAALVETLDHIGAGRTLELVAALDAWVEGRITFCLVYEPPFSKGAVVGIRCVREDEEEEPAVGASQCLDDIGEPLGNRAHGLRYDTHGIGWWGTLDDALPVRPG